DCPKFAFTVPSVNRQAPARRYEWLVLPQGCKNSPAICQRVVADALMPVRPPEQTYLDSVLSFAIETLQKSGFTIAEEKVQKTTPVKYLGLQLLDKTITPQPLVIRNEPRTLKQLMSLCGSINWLRPFLHLPNSDLEPLFHLLRGSDALNSPRHLTPEAKESLQKVADAISHAKAHRCDPSLPFQLAILGESPFNYGLLYQWDTQTHTHEALLIIEFLFTHHSHARTVVTPVEVVAELITKARLRIRTLAGCDLSCVVVPWKKSEFNSVYQTNSALQLALDSYPGQVSYGHFPKHRMFKETFNLAPKSLKSSVPLAALNVFTDGS
ncbi:POK18 protein, partial [Campylorhamphus procurvoides]|nr:POK18 protein [Campylorhamphus procurvoides]